MIRIGTLGAAKIAPFALVKPVAGVDGVELVSVAARDVKRARRFADKHGIEKVHESYEALIADPDIDAIYNPLPNNLHAQWTEAAIAAGKHVLCEKPFASNAAEAARVSEISSAAGLVVMEAFHYRHHPLAKRMYELCASEELGVLRRAETWMCIPLPFRKDIRYRLDLSGGATMDTGCYAIHMLRTITRQEPVVRSAKAQLMSEGVDRSMTANFDFDNGVTGRMTCSLLAWPLLKIGAKVEFEKGELQILNPVAPQLFHRFRYRRSGEKWKSETFPKKATYTYQLEAFVDAITKGKPVLTTTQDAILNMRAIDSVYQAAGLSPRGPLRGHG